MTEVKILTYSPTKRGKHVLYININVKQVKFNQFTADWFTVLADILLANGESAQSSLLVSSSTITIFFLELNLGSKM